VVASPPEITSSDAVALDRLAATSTAADTNPKVAVTWTVAKPPQGADPGGTESIVATGPTEQERSARLDAEPEELAEEIVEEAPTTSSSSAVGGPLSLAQPNYLLAGAVPIDLAGLKQASDLLFERIEALGDTLAGSPARWSLGQWLLVSAVAAGGFEFTRRRIVAQGDSEPGSSDSDPSALLDLFLPGGPS
jgi:hypothetical protein